jgi:hypothetical protein
MANDALGDRKIFASGFDFLAQPWNTDEKYALNRALPRLAGAVAEACDLYDVDGQVIGLAAGKLDIVTPAILGKMIGENLVRKSVRNTGTIEQPVFEREYRPVAVSEANIRRLLTDKEYGLAGLLPRLEAADVTPRGAEPPAVETPPEPEAPATINPAEIEAGKRTAAKWAELGSAEQTKIEREQGARVAAKHKARGAA